MGSSRVLFLDFIGPVCGSMYPVRTEYADGTSGQLPDNTWPGIIGSPLPKAVLPRFAIAIGIRAGQLSTRGKGETTRTPRPRPRLGFG